MVFSFIHIYLNLAFLKEKNSKGLQPKVKVETVHILEWIAWNSMFLIEVLLGGRQYRGTSRVSQTSTLGEPKGLYTPQWDCLIYFL